MQAPAPALKRQLGLTLLVLYGLGNILGAGIYVLVGQVSAAAGHHAPLAFVVAAIVAAFTAFSYGELAARYPVSAGEAIYMHKAFANKPLSITVGLLIAMAGLASTATLARGFVGYARVLLPVADSLMITALVLALGLTAAWGIRQSVRIAAALTLVEVGGLLLVIGVGADALMELPIRLPSLLPAWEVGVLSGILGGAFLAFFAFIGFEDMVNIAEEVREPERILPLGIVIALIISTAIYFVVVLIATLNVAPDQLAQSDAPLALVYRHATGTEPVLIGAIGALAAINGGLVQIIMASRIFYGMSNHGWLPAVLKTVHPRTHTPVIATVLAAAIVWALALWIPIVQLAGATSFLVLTVFTLVNLALIRIKLREPQPVGVRPIAFWLPVAGLLSSAGLLITQVLLSIHTD